MNKSNLHNKRLQSLNKGKTKSLGPVEKITMTYAGRIDGKKNLLRCNENGIWQSSTLKQEVDSYEEFCAEQMGKLKLQEEDEFKKLNILFDQVIPLRKKLLESKNLLRNAMDEEVDLTSRKEGEDLSLIHILQHLPGFSCQDDGRPSAYPDAHPECLLYMAL